MKTEVVHLSQIQVNAANPRTITDSKFEKLINSILVLPKMLELRPIVVDNTFVALGGNMRFRALSSIADMDVEEIKSRLADVRDFQKKTTAEQNNLVEYWERWKDKPTAYIIRATELSEEEKREFIIKDNVGFGDWDWTLWQTSGTRTILWIGVSMYGKTRNGKTGMKAGVPTVLRQTLH